MNSDIVKFGVIGAFVGLSWAYVSQKAQQHISGKLFGVEHESLHKNYKIYSNLITLKEQVTTQVDLQDAYKSLVVLYDKLLTLYFGLKECKRDKISSREEPLKKAYAYYDQICVYVKTFVDATFNETDAYKVVKIQKCCHSLRKESMNVMGSILALTRV